MSTALLCPTTRPGSPPDPLGSTFSLIPYRLDTLRVSTLRVSTFCSFWTSSSLRYRPRVSWRFHAHCSGYSTKAILVGNHPGLLSRSIFWGGARRVRVGPTFPFPAFSRIARPSSAVGPLGVPMCLLVNIFALQCLRSPGFKTLESCPAMSRMSILMTLMPTFVRLVVRGHALKGLTMQFDHAEIAKSFQEFNDVLKAKPYQRQKSALEQELLDFLASLSPPRDVSSRTSDDIIKFLISKDKSGKTVLHSRSCSEVHCNCPTPLAAGSVDSLLGNLRAIFNNLSRLHDSNPVAHARVKEYLKFIR